MDTTEPTDSTSDLAPVAAPQATEVMEVRRPDRDVQSVDFAELAAIDARAQDDARARNTKRAYASRWDLYEDWCIEQRLCPAPAEPAVVRAYVASLRRQNLRMSTINQTVAAIWARHTDEHLPCPARTDPALRLSLAGYTRQDAEDPMKAPQQMEALLADQARLLLSVMDITLADQLAEHDDARVQRRYRLLDLRDRAVILTGLATALRRKELAALQITSIAHDEYGVVITPAKTKSDQSGTRRAPRPMPRGTDAGFCPVTALNRWLNAAQITEGPVFRPVLRWGTTASRAISPQVVRTIVLERAEAAHLPGTWGAHSLRAGFATQASRNGASRNSIMADGDWKSSAVDRYIRRGQLWDDPAAGRIF